MSQNDRIEPFAGSASQQAGGADIQQQLDELRQLIQNIIATHHHGAGEAQPIRIETDLSGLIECVSSAPTAPPGNVYEQFKIYHNGTTDRLYVYNWSTQVWHFVLLG